MMEPESTPEAKLLYQAAEKLRALLQKMEPWEGDEENGIASWDQEHSENHADDRFIRTFNPGVAHIMVDVLNREAKDADEIGANYLMVSIARMILEEK